MKKSILITTLGILVLVGFVALVPNEFSPTSQEKILRHVVLLDLNEQATDSVLQKMERDVQALKENIPEIKDLEWGSNIQTDGEYSHCLLLTFEDAESLNRYEEHPRHLEFASTYGQYVLKKTEVDYWR